MVKKVKTCNNCGSEVHTNTKECKCGNTEFISNISNLEVKSRIDIIEEAEQYFNFNAPISYEAGTLICLKMEDKFVRISDITRELRNIINSLPKYSCDIDSSIIGDLIKRLENAKQ